MKTWVDKLRDCTDERLANLIKAQKREIAIKVRDLETMERILAERTQNPAVEGRPGNGGSK